MVPAGIVEVTEMLVDLLVVLLITPAAQKIIRHLFQTTSHKVPEPMLVELVNNFHQDIQRQYLDSTNDDIDMISVGEAMIETPDYSIPTIWISQPEHRYSIYKSVSLRSLTISINDIKLTPGTPSIIFMKIGPQW